MSKGLSLSPRFVLTLTAALVALAGVSLAVPRDYAGPELYPDVQRSAPLIEESPSGVTSVSAEGDTIYAVCNLRTFQFTSAGGTDCWGWEAPDGTEYAIMGVYEGIAYVDVTSMQIIDTVSGPVNNCGGVRWRDMATYQNYCYAVSECDGLNQGVMIMDMSYLPDSVHLVGTHVTGDFTSHNLVIDTAEGYLYAVNRFSNGMRIISLANPEVPVEIGTVAVPDIHDMFARNDTAWIAEGSNGTWSVWNLANKNSPQLIQRVSVPASGYVHNIWPNGAGTHLITTEETSFKTIKYWDVTDYNNVQLVSTYLAPSNLAHNAHMKGDTAYISHYESGVAVVDFSDPLNPVELAVYDTYGGGENPGFSGCWGAYPFTSSGKIYASNGDGRLFVLNEQIVNTMDTAYGDSSLVEPGQQVRVDVSFDNQIPLTGLNLPFTWAGTFGMSLDSASTYGLRTDYFEQQSYTAFDGANSRAGYGILAGNAAPLPPGNGPVISLYFSVPPGAVGPENLVEFTPFASLVPEVIMSCVQFEINTAPAVITLDETSCCQGLTGNVDQDASNQVNLTDLTLLVNSLFVTFDTLPCPEAANVSGDLAGDVNLTDVTALTNSLFVTFESTAACQ